MIYQKIYRSIFLLGFFGVLVSTGNAQIIQYGFEADSSWSLPFARVTADSTLEYDQYPQTDIPFVTRYAMRFTPENSGMLESIGVMFSDIIPEQPDSTQFLYSDGDSTKSLPLLHNSGDETFLKYASRFESPYVGFIDSIGVRLSTCCTELDDSLSISFLAPNYNAEEEFQKEQHYRDGATWAFSLPRETNNVTQYGVRFTGPASVDSLQLAKTRFFLHGINDFNGQGWVSGFDTPANDTLLIHVYSVSPSDSLPEKQLLTRKRGFSDLNSGFFNTIDISDANIFDNDDRELAITLETKVVENKDFIWLLSGDSFPEPKKRTLMLENGEWKFLSESDSWGDSGAKGAEIKVEALFRGDINQLAPDSTTVLTDPLHYPLSKLKKDVLNKIALPEPVRLIKGESVWISYGLKRVGKMDSTGIVARYSSRSTEELKRSTAVLVKGDTTRRWKFTGEVGNQRFGANLVLENKAYFRKERNDRVFFKLHGSGPDNQPAEVIHQTSVRTRDIPTDTVFNIDVRTWQYEALADEDIHVSVSTGIIGKSDGFKLAADKTENVSRASFRDEQGSWMPLSERPNGGGMQFVMPIHLSKATSLTDHEKLNLPEKTDINSIYPNPFNPTTRISFYIPSRQKVSVDVFSLTGKRVANLQEGILSAGNHERVLDAAHLSSGVYVVRLKGQQATSYRKITLIK